MASTAPDEHVPNYGDDMAKSSTGPGMAVPRIDTLNSPVAAEVFEFGNMNSPMAPEAVSPFSNLRSGTMGNVNSPIAPEAVSPFTNLNSPHTPGTTVQSVSPQTWYDDAARPEAWRNSKVESSGKEAFNIVDKEALKTDEKTATSQSSVGSLKESTVYSREPRKPFRRWLWALVAVIVALCLMGAGIGIGYVVVKNKGTSSSSPPKSSPSYPAFSGNSSAPRGDGRCGPQFDGATCSAQTGWGQCCSSHGWCGDNAAHCSISQGCIWGCVSPTNSSSSPVTSGTTGIASFSCNSTTDSLYTSTAASDPVEFREVCYTEFRDGAPTWNSSSRPDVVSEVTSPVTVYSFQDCMDECVQYNSKASPDGSACHAVTFSANLTASVSHLGGNCFLKNARGVGYNGDPSTDYSLMASAYIFV